MAVKSMEFMRRNLERISTYLPKDRHVRDVYSQLIYDSAFIYSSLHDQLEIAVTGFNTTRMP
jgi:hypothetical protein